MPDSRRGCRNQRRIASRRLVGNPMTAVLPCRYRPAPPRARTKTCKFRKYTHGEMGHTCNKWQVRNKGLILSSFPLITMVDHDGALLPVVDSKADDRSLSLRARHRNRRWYIHQQTQNPFHLPPKASKPTHLDSAMTFNTSGSSPSSLALFSLSLLEASRAAMTSRSSFSPAPNDCDKRTTARRCYLVTGGSNFFFCPSLKKRDNCVLYAQQYVYIVKTQEFQRNGRDRDGNKRC